MKTLRKIDGLETNIDASFATRGLVSTNLFGLVRRAQGVPQDQLYILVDDSAGTDVRRGDPSGSLWSCANNTGSAGYHYRKLPVSLDSGRMEAEISLWVWDSKTK